MYKPFNISTMKTLGLLIVSLMITNNLFSQECKVLKPEISNSYQGECKNGLAQGKGVAKGTDVYEGEFKKGLPDGEGTYVWANGSTYVGDWRKGIMDGKGKYTWHTSKGDSTQVGIWRRGKYEGTGIPAYVINRNQSVPRYTIRKSLGNLDRITIQFMRAGSNFNEVSNLTVSSDSGSDETKGPNLIINDAIFPVNIKLDFTVPNLLKTAEYNCIFNFTITEKGSWDVILNL